MVLPAGFTDKAAAAFAGHGEEPELTILYDPTHKIEQTVAQSAVRRHVVEALGDLGGGRRARPGQEL